MATFTTMPREIRDQIYKLCLITDKFIYPYVTYYEEMDGIEPYNKQADKLAVSLLIVSKQIRDEAAPILFGGNTFHLCLVNPCKSQISVPERLWSVHEKHFRHIELAFDARDIHPDIILPAYDEVEDFMSQPITLRYSRITEFHEHLLRRLQILWEWKLDIIWNFVHLGKATFRFDISNCYCTQKCCDQFPYFFDYLMHYCLTKGFNKRCTIQGLIAKEHFKWLHKKGYLCQFCPSKQGESLSAKCEWATRTLPAPKTQSVEDDIVPG